MIVRAVRGALTVTVLAATGLTVAAPAQAAQADITVTSANVANINELQVYGTVTCTGSTGAAHITVTATQVMPFSFGSASINVPCASGPVPWEVTLFSGFGWQSFHTVSVNAHMTDDDAGTDSSSGTWFV
ncbi:hypothetical protein [Micromonospora sp. RTGN7]|uniref:hypothetical protein n=1 Tax=Micromonospora sp. RTGN7 TaxID=3016526 RepID=UPI0029FF378E|nr:hypothetical protein [Micromonospora sp. RTGN7]